MDAAQEESGNVILVSKIYESHARCGQPDRTVIKPRKHTSLRIPDSVGAGGCSRVETGIFLVRSTCRASLTLFVLNFYACIHLTQTIFVFYWIFIHAFPQVSKEGESFTVPIAVAKMSKLVEITIDGESDDETQEIPLPNVKASILGKVIEYCTHYITVEPMTPITTPLKSPKIEEVVQQWYADFVKVDQTILFELVTSANFMDIKPLLDLTCFAVAVFIKGKSADEIRKIFNISNDFTPDEEAQVREENKWCEN